MNLFHGSHCLNLTESVSFLVSVISGLLITILIISEFSYYRNVEVTPQLVVDTSRAEDQKLRINFDVVVKKIPCECKGGLPPTFLFGSAWWLMVLV